MDFCWFVSVCSLLVFLYLTLCMFYWNYCFSLCLPDVTVCFFFSKSASHFCISDWEKTVIRFVMMCSIKESSPSHFYDASSWHVSTQVHFEWRGNLLGFWGDPLTMNKIVILALLKIYFLIRETLLPLNAHPELTRVSLSLSPPHTHTLSFSHNPHSLSFLILTIQHSTAAL